MDPSTVAEPISLHGKPLAVPEDAGRFMGVRGGDHTLTAFQCPLCQCRNIKGRDLSESWQDKLFECQLIRATIDAFWSRAVGTLDNHVNELRFQIKYGRALGVDTLPPLGPWPLGEDMGMKHALTLECRSHEKGKHGRNVVTYSTSRKARTVHTNIWGVSPLSGADISFSSGKARFFATRCPSQSQWFEHFSRGFRIRTGVQVRQDKAYTLEVLHELLRRFESEWYDMEGEVTMHWISGVMFLLTSCLGGMRGYEVVWTDLAALIHDIERCEEDGIEEGVGWPIVGRFKAEGGGIGGHIIPIAGVTKSGIDFFKWTQRFVRLHLDHGRSEGWAFVSSTGERAKAAEYREMIFDKLVSIQEERPDLIDPIVDVYESYGVQRSGRRFFDTECRIRGVKAKDIEAQCRWIRDRAAKGIPAPRDMVDCYTEYKHMRKVLLRPSQAL